MNDYYFTGQWAFPKFSELGEGNFNRLCLQLLRAEISLDVQPTNKVGRDNKCDAFLLPCYNKYGLDGLWWFQFKFRDHTRNDNTKLKSRFKSELTAELDGVVKKKTLPKNYLVITPVELSGQDWTNWYQDNILAKYSSFIPNIRIWDYSKINSLLDAYPTIKLDFEKLFFGGQVSAIPAQTIKSTSSILLIQDLPFSNKLDYLLKIIKKDASIDSREVKVSLCILSDENKLAWHFLKNLKDEDWFPKIRDNIIKSIVESEEDNAVKYQLLNYFETCAEKYSDEIVPLITQLEKNTQNYTILSNLVKTLGKLKPKYKRNVDLLWEVFSKLTEHQHPWVRREIPQALLPFIEYDVDKVLNILEKIFFYNPPPQDVTQGTPTLALTFQGRDNENWVFEEAIQTLGKLLNDAKYVEKALELAIKIEIEAINAEEKDLEIVNGITLDYSYIWLNDKSFEKTEYNHNRKERVALEIEKSLDEFSKSDNKLTTQLITKIVDKKFEVFYLVIIKTLMKRIANYQIEIKSLIFNKTVWGIFNIRNYYLQTLITKYFEINKGKELSKFIKLVVSYKEKDRKRTLYTKQNLLISIPESQRTKEVIYMLKAITNKLNLKSKPKIEKSFVMTTWSGPRPDITLDELEKKNDDELVQIMVESSMGKRAGAWDLRHIFAGLVDRNPDRLKRLLPKIRNKKLEPDFAGEMISTFIKKNSGNISDIVNLIPQLSKKDTWARIEIARFLNDICRQKEIQKYSQSVIKEIKNSLFILSTDEHPQTDETIKSNHPKPDDAITRGINSVRGIATEALVAFYYYFPEDNEVAKKIKELADDNTKAVKATLLYNLRYLIEKNYQLCGEIINKFKNRRDPEIDFALIHFFAQLDCSKFIASEDFIKSLFNNTDEQINEDLGELVGYKFINGCDVKNLLDDVTGNRKGTKHTLRSLAFVFESQMAVIVGSERDKEIASYLKKLMNPQYGFEVVERASFVFQRDEIRPEQFSFLDENGLISELLLNTLNIPAQSHLVDYLHRCIEANVSVERCVEVLHEQVTKIESILSDHLIAKKISEIVSKLIKTNLSSTISKYLFEIFNEGLERGWDEFYAIYHDPQVRNQI